MFTLTTLKVTKGSYLKIGIPTDFDIYDATVAASTCVRVSGFPDEVSCIVTLYTSITTANSKHYITVRNGFDSDDFEGGSFSFNISEIRNPKNSKETGAFSFEVYDSLGNLEYQYTGIDITFKMSPAPFYYSLVTSANP